MNRVRDVVGLIAAAVLVTSSVAHSLVGWKVLAARLRTVGAPADLITGLQAGWHFGGVAMLLLGLIAADLFLQRFRGRTPRMLPVWWIGTAYTIFGLWGLAASDLDPFFAIFILPGIMLLVAAQRPRAKRHDRFGAAA